MRRPERQRHPVAGADLLLGTGIDHETGLPESGFGFRKPNVAERCGCGESVTFKDAEAG